MGKFTSKIWGAALGLVMSGSIAPAATITSTQSGNWSSSLTWGGNPVPTAADIVIIDGGFTVTVDISDAACANIQLGGSATGSGDGTLSFNGGSQLVVGLVTVGVGNRKGNITMAGGGILSCSGFVINSSGTWTPGTGTVEFTATNTLPNNSITTFNNLNVSNGTTTLNANTTVSGDFFIDTQGTLDGGIHQLTIGGTWINNGTFSGNTGTVIFNKNGNQTISGTGINNFNLIKLNMGTSSANILDVIATNFNAPDAFLTLSGGTFKVSGTFSFSNSFILGPAYNIPTTGGLWINNPNVTVTAQAGGVSVRGLLRISAGIYNVGNATDNNMDYMPGAVITIEGGALNVAGHLGRNNATSNVSYTQTGGKVTVATQGSTDLVFAGFDIGAATSSFTVSGGSIIVSNETSAPADYLIAASTANVTGGTLQLGDLNSLNAQTIRIQSSAPVGNLLVSNVTSQTTKPTAKLVSFGLNVNGNVLVQTGTALNANGLNIAVGGAWADSGAFMPGPIVTFNGTGAQTIAKPGGESFNGLTISKSSGTLTIIDNVTVNGNFSLSQGTVDITSKTLTLNNGVTGGGTLTGGTASTVIYNQTTDGQSVLAGTYSNLTFNNFNKTLATTGIIAVAGTFTPGSSTGHIVTGSTMNFSGGAQDIPAFTYNNLMMSGSGTKTGSGTITVNGNFTNNPGITFSGVTVLELKGTAHLNNGILNALTLSVGPSATITNNGTINAGTSLTGAGALIQGNNSILTIGGGTDISNLNASALGNTVNYAGAGQTVLPSAYHNLTLSGYGIPILNGVSTIGGNFTLLGTVSATATNGITVSGNLSVSAGSTFSAGSFSHILSGNLAISGTFVAGTSTFNLNGTGAQTVDGSTFYNLSIDNVSGVSLLGNEIVSNKLTLTNGIFSIGNHTLTLNGEITTVSGSISGGTTSKLVIGGSGTGFALPGITLGDLILDRLDGASLSGNVTISDSLKVRNGTLTTGNNTINLGSSAVLLEPAGQPVVGNISTIRSVTTTSGTIAFGNIGAEIVLNGTAIGNTTVTRKTGAVSTGNGHTSIKRYFDISPTVNAGLNAGFIFHYDTTELNFQNARILEIFRSSNSGTTWSDLGGNAIVSAKTITITGINEFSRMTAADTFNSIGITATPTTIDISPKTKTVGDPEFILTVNGSNFINGKSAVIFNGNVRTTTFVSSSQLTVLIPASDLIATGSFSLKVNNTGGGGVSNSQTFTIATAGTATGIAEVHQSEFKLMQNCPNPFVSSTTIEYELAVGSHVRLTIVDFKGTVVTTLVDENQEAGPKSIIFNAGYVSKGVYFYRLETEDFVATRKLIIY